MTVRSETGSSAAGVDGSPGGAVEVPEPVGERQGRQPVSDVTEPPCDVQDPFAASKCGFCKGRPVGDAATWVDGKPRPPLPCPRCGVTTPRTKVGCCGFPEACSPEDCLEQQAQAERGSASTEAPSVSPARSDR